MKTTLGGPCGRAHITEAQQLSRWIDLFQPERRKGYLTHAQGGRQWYASTVRAIEAKKGA